ncbi:hypothetical protein Tco_0010228 [Tanacetum coccineum]
MGCLPRSACLGSLSLTQSPNSFVLGEGLEIRDNQLWYIPSKVVLNSMTVHLEVWPGVLRKLNGAIWKDLGNGEWPSRLCARAQLVDDMPFRTRACMEYTRWVFCKRYGMPKVRHLVYSTKMHGSRPQSFQEFVSSHDWIPQLAYLFVGDMRWRDGE